MNIALGETLRIRPTEKNNGLQVRQLRYTQLSVFHFVKRKA